MERILFICKFGQSRSKYFAEMCMEKGIKALFAGFEQSDFSNPLLDYWMLEWADTVVVLDEDLYNSEYAHLVNKTVVSETYDLIDYFIDDDPKNFPQYFYDLGLVNTFSMF